MIGSAVFVTIPLVLSAMGGPQAFLGWLLGMLISLADGLVWAEFGAALPGAGGTYLYLQEAFGPARWGRLLSFVYLWGSLFIMPLILAFLAVSFSQYGRYFWTNMTPWQGKLLAAGMCLLTTALLYRDIVSVGRLSLLIWAVVVLAAAWIVTTGLWHFDPKLAFDFPPGAFHLAPSFFAGLGAATLIATLDYGGYQNICFVAGEVKHPAYTIPRSILYAIVGVAFFYTLTSITIIGVLPWREAAQSSTVVSDFIERLHGRKAEQQVSAMVLWAILGSLFTSLLGFSRVLYAGAVDGQFFSLLARVHPTKHFPSASVLALGGISALFCVLDLKSLAKNIMALNALTGSIPQVIGLMVLRARRPEIVLPFRMWLYPVPALLALIGWVFVLLSNDLGVILTWVSVTLLGVLVYLGRAQIQGAWPFGLTR
jgi:amino acid transporter